MYIHKNRQNITNISNKPGAVYTSVPTVLSLVSKTIDRIC